MTGRTVRTGSGRKEVLKGNEEMNLVVEGLDWSRCSVYETFLPETPVCVDSFRRPLGQTVGDPVDLVGPGPL